MSESLDKMAGVFLDEANDLLDKLEDYLLDLEEHPDDMETISAVFRSMHTIKGSAGMFGYDKVSHFCHEAETTFDEVRNGRLAVTSKLITLTLQARDHIRNMLDDQNSPEINAETERLISEFQVILLQNDTSSASKPEEKPVPAAAEKPQGKPAEGNGSSFVISTPEPQKTAPEDQMAQSSAPDNNEEEVEKTWRISFEPALDIFMNGTRPHALLAELAEMGAVSITPFFSAIPSLEDIDPCQCYMSWDIILTTSKPENDINDVFIFLDPGSKVKISKLTEVDETGPQVPKKLGEILIEKNLVTQEEIDHALGNQKPLGTILTENKLVSKEAVQSALAEQKHLREQTEKKTQEVSNQTIKINSEKLDMLIDLVGELVTFNARMAQVSTQIDSSALSTLSEQGERLILQLRDTTMDMRMLPIGTIFTRFKRLVRDLSSQTNKQIELITEGAETELDKTVIEKLNDPLVHLIRNSCDHGVEAPEVREQNGKNPVGTVTLRAQHAGAFVLISIEDDGAGLNLEKIKSKAIERGLISPQDELTDEEAADLIFRPGFSTADKVSSISGRGVGMDVVKKDITSLGGTVTTTTKAGKGTCFTLKIPLTLAIIEGILIRNGEHYYVLPLSNVDQCIAFDPSLTRKGAFCSSIKIRDEMVPYIDLRTFFGMEEGRPEQQQMVIVNDQDTKIGIVIDNVIGNHQTVIKPLGKLYKNVEGISGATILGDGSVALILDIYKLSEIVKELDANNT
ncbi:MAG: chemotaxis protein CheA [Treponema sp.]|nr:chemotaxis protein CheA [Candidatus Treponema caballi]